MDNYVYFIWLPSPEDLEKYKEKIDFEAKCDYAFKGQLSIQYPLKYGVFENHSGKGEKEIYYFKKFFGGNAQVLEQMKPEIINFEGEKTFPVWTKYGIVIFKKDEMFLDFLGYHNPLGELIF